MDDDVSPIEIHQRIIRGLVRSRDVALGFEIEGDLVGQRALDMEGDSAPFRQSAGADGP